MGVLVNTPIDLPGPGTQHFPQMLLSFPLNPKSETGSWCQSGISREFPQDKKKKKKYGQLQDWYPQSPFQGLLTSKILSPMAIKMTRLKVKSKPWYAAGVTFICQRIRFLPFMPLLTNLLLKPKFHHLLFKRSMLKIVV